MLRGQDSDLLRELMGLPGKPFPTLPQHFSKHWKNVRVIRSPGGAEKNRDYLPKL